jgi:uncharacterized membrane protein
MGKNRLEAFSDGVIAIIIMVLELEFRTAAISGRYCRCGPSS